MAVDLPPSAPNPTYPPPPPVTSTGGGARTLGQLALVLGVVALVLGASALAISLTHAGPAGTNGATGSQGIQGVPGPGTLFDSSSYHEQANDLNTTCTNMSNVEVTFTVSEPGTVVVSGYVTITILHTTGDLGAAALFIGNNTTASCPGSLTV